MTKFELRIHDEGKESGILIGFNMFMHALVDCIGSKLDQQWEIFHGACGYGELICSVEDSLEDVQAIYIDPANLIEVLLEGAEYFNNVRIRIADSDIEFGIHDNTFFNVIGQREELEQIAAFFTRTEILKVEENK